MRSTSAPSDIIAGRKRVFQHVTGLTGILPDDDGRPAAAAPAMAGGLRKDMGGRPAELQGCLSRHRVDVRDGANAVRAEDFARLLCSGGSGGGDVLVARLRHVIPRVGGI